MRIAVKPLRLDTRNFAAALVQKCKAQIPPLEETLRAEIKEIAPDF